jgi:hypothetical protein
METLFTLKTSSFDPSKTLPNKFVFNSSGCSGDNVSPELEWTGAPKATKSFAITVFDPDAPTDKGWWHWTVANIPADVTTIEEGASNNNKLPMGAVEGKTDFGTSGYGGACPPPGHKAHRYIFTVYALKTDRINIDKNTSGEAIDNQINANAIAKASFTVKYGRT